MLERFAGHNDDTDEEERMTLDRFITRTLRAAKLEAEAAEAFEYADDMWAASPWDAPDSPEVIFQNQIARAAQDRAVRLHSLATVARALADEAAEALTPARVQHAA